MTMHTTLVFQKIVLQLFLFPVITFKEFLQQIIKYFPWLLSIIWPISLILLCLGWEEQKANNRFKQW